MDWGQYRALTLLLFNSSLLKTPIGEAERRLKEHNILEDGSNSDSASGSMAPAISVNILSH